MKPQYALIGYPLGHTMSPPIHKRLFELTDNPNAEYTTIEIPPEKFDERVPGLFSLDGFNVTIPYKLKIIQHLDKLDDSANRYGSVNVVKCSEKNIGYNTDVDGFLRSIKALGADLSGRVLLIGCGGVGRMMAVETALAGGRLVIAEREQELESARAAAKDIQQMADSAKIDIVSSNNINGDFDLIINSSPCGMHPNINDIPVKEDVLKRTGFLFDAIYNPAETKSMRIARENGAKVMGGMNMLVWQAAVSHEIWENVSYSPAAVQELAEEMQRLAKE